MIDWLQYVNVYPALTMQIGLEVQERILEHTTDLLLDGIVTDETECSGEACKQVNNRTSTVREECVLGSFKKNYNKHLSL